MGGESLPPKKVQQIGAVSTRTYIVGQHRIEDSLFMTTIANVFPIWKNVLRIWRNIFHSEFNRLLENKCPQIVNDTVQKNVVEFQVEVLFVKCVRNIFVGGIQKT